MSVKNRIAGFLISLFLVIPTTLSAGISVTLNGTPLSVSPAPLLKDGRTLIPLRSLFEALHATVRWEDGTGVVTATRADKYVRFTVGSRFACLDAECRTGALMDVPSQLINYKTFVPIRFVATALGVDVTWDGPTQTVFLTDPASNLSDAPVVRLLDPPANITGTVALKASVTGMTPNQLKFYLLDKKTIRGPLIAHGSDPAQSYSYKPDPALNDERYLVAVAYDSANKAFYSELTSVKIEASPVFSLSGVQPGQTITGKVGLQTSHDFVAAYTEYELIDSTTGSGALLGQSDPDNVFHWFPQVGQTGNKELRATLYDRTGKAYATQSVPVTLAPAPVFSQEGLADGKQITEALTVTVTANFPVKKMELRSGDVLLYEAGRTGPVSLYQSSSQQIGTFTWTPTLGQNGDYTVKLMIYDESGKVYETESFALGIHIEPRLRLNVGPDQVISQVTELKVSSNVPLQKTWLELTDPATGKVERLATGTDGLSYLFTPLAKTNKNYQLEAFAEDGNGTLLTSGKRNIKVMTLPTYGATAIVAKDKFRGLIEPLAIAALERTNMSASVQAAQAILESGWGQYVPTDKYTGQVSNNLFGIKGTGPAGSVVSGTSEVYNGLRYSIDANFRAYNEVSQSWQDHKDLLLIRPWYAPFRAVMHDPVQGPWGLKRSGYATSPVYAISLIKLQEQQNLWVLDWVMP